MLTIGQLADYVGVTVRAVRHYHQRGLLPEPERDASGYRRYGAQAVVDLIRIKTLADAGVPLARIQALLGAEPEPFAQGIAQIDQALRRRIRDLERQRHRIAELAAGDRLFLPDEIVALLDELRRLGVSQRAVDTERDGWILLAAHSPGRAAEWAQRSGQPSPTRSSGVSTWLSTRPLTGIRPTPGSTIWPTPWWPSPPATARAHAAPARWTTRSPWTCCRRNPAAPPRPGTG